MTDTPNQSDDDAFWTLGQDEAHAGPPPSVEQFAAAPDTVTLPKKAFSIGVAVASALILVLAVLWRSGGDGSSDAAGGEGSATPTPEPAAGAEPDADAAVDGEDDPAVARVGELERDVADLGGLVADLEAELAAVQPPALPGSALRRIVVAADASFVSLGNEGLAVIGPFGGYAAVDPATNSVTATAQVASGATRVMRTASAVWITNYTDNQIIRVDPVSDAVVHTIGFAGPDGVAKRGPALIVASSDGGFVARVDPGSGDILEQVEVLGTPSDVLVSADDSTVWAAVSDTGEVVRIDASTFEVTDRVTVGAGPKALTLVDGVLWVTNNSEGTVAAVDVETLAVLATVPVGPGPTAVEVYSDSAWVSVTDAGELVQLDRDTYEVITRTPLGSSNRGGPTGMTVGAGSLWIAMQGERSVVRLSLPGG